MRAAYTYQKLFRDPSLLAEMLSLKSSGLTNDQLAKRYGCTRRAIMWRCMKASGQIIPKPRKRKPGPMPYPYQEIIESAMPNRGHSYRKYLRLEKTERDLEELTISAIIDMLDAR